MYSVNSYNSYNFNSYYNNNEIYNKISQNTDIKLNLLALCPMPMFYSMQ